MTKLNWLTDQSIYWCVYGRLVVQSLSCIQLFATPWTAAHQASPSSTISRSLIKFMSIESVMLSNHLILCCPLLLLPSILPTVRVFPNESALCIRWPKYWSFTFSIIPANEYLGDLVDFLQECLVWSPCCPMDSFQHHNSKASIHLCSVIFTVQLSHLYMTIGYTIALNIQTFVRKVLALLFTILSRFVKAIVGLKVESYHSVVSDSLRPHRL